MTLAQSPGVSDQPLRADISLDPDRRLLRMRLSGRPGTVAIRRAVAAVLARLGESPGVDVYSDHRDLTAPLDPSQLEVFVAQLDLAARLLRGRRWAVVVGSAASYGMMRMLSVHAQRVPLEVAVFWGPEAAEAWLAGDDEAPLDAGGPVGGAQG